MKGINKVIIFGNLGADPEQRQFNNGGMVTNISVATSERWTDKQTGEKKEQTEWHRVVFFNRLAEVAAQYLRKGSSVYIEGKLKTRKWQDQNNIDRYTTEIVANELQMLGDKNDQINTANNSQQQGQGFQQQPTSQQQATYRRNPEPQQQFNNQMTEAAATPGISDEDIPFAPFFAA